ncbi:Protein SWT-7 [Aphelenchoides avenae]|nr:Protein SWT-7 [Aphelenchus avenae]
MGIFEIFTAWLTLFSISFTFLPIFVILEWRKRGTAEGFSSVNFVLPILMYVDSYFTGANYDWFRMSCWFRHGYMTNDPLNIYLNAFNLVVFAFYILAFAYYQPKRKYLYGQLASLGLTIWSLFRYVDGHPRPEQPELMAAIAAATQIAGLAGGIYDVKRAISLETTEYIPAQIHGPSSASS